MSEEVREEVITAASGTNNGDASEAVPPAYFLSLSVENARCFKQKQTLDLSNGKGRPAQWTLILGDNGVGKTTLLQLLASMQPELLQYSTPANDKIEGYYPRLSPLDSKMDAFRDSLLYIDAHSIALEDVIDQSLEVSCFVSCGRSLSSSEVAYKQQYSVTLYASRGGATSHVNVLARGLICYGYGASRRMGTTSLSESLNPDTSASLFSDTVELLNAEGWLLQADYAVSRSKGAERRRAELRFNCVKDTLIQLLPDVSDLRIGSASPASMQAHVQAKTPYGWVPIQGLSLGYRALLTWMVDLAARLFERYPGSKNPLAEPAVVLVDEIDLHLHPRWQRTLLRFLSDTFPNTQFIATAHSPLVVQAATDANIVLLRREGDHVVIENDVEKIKGWRIDQVLTSDLFGLQSARPPQLDHALQERDRLLAKSRLTKADKAKLAQLESEIGALPTGETPADIEAMDIIRRAAGLLK